VRLRPELEVGRLPAPMPAAQVTRPAAGDGGVVVGAFVHHAVADGNSVWQSIVRAKALDLDHGGDDDTCYFLVPVDCRTTARATSGTALPVLSYAKATARDLAEPNDGVAHAAAAIRGAARETLANPLLGAERWAEAYAGCPARGSRRRGRPTVRGVRDGHGLGRPEPG